MKTTQQERWYSGETQIYWCCKALITWREISHKTEIREVRGWRLSAIIHTLKSQYNWPILVECRGPECVAYYWLATDTDLSKLKFPPSAASLATQDGEEAA